MASASGRKYPVLNEDSKVDLAIIEEASPASCPPTCLAKKVRLAPEIGSLTMPVLILRILDEEKGLKEELPGYAEYMQKVGYRLVPYLW